MENINSDNSIEKIEFLITRLVDFSNENEFDHTLYLSFANEKAKTFNRYFAEIDNETHKAKIISDLKTNFHFEVDNIVNEMLSTKDNTQYPSDGTTYYISRPILDTRIKSYKNNYKELIQLFLNSVEFETKSKVKDKTKEAWFLTGIQLANGKAYELRDQGFSFRDIALKLGFKASDNSYFSTSFGTSKDSKNIFNSLDRLKEIIEHCNLHDIKICSKFSSECASKYQNELIFN
ncbi:hypothetical protein [Flavobacterium sp.]|uniref:hypothetical protein n=1 Tax=Flavobacterium sp. TaxID=239 RepID=UPI003267C34B